jgi:hypothetical protein
MQEVANKIERGFSLNKAVQEEKIPELLKRKTSMQKTLESDIGSMQKINALKMEEWDRPVERISG